MGETEADRQVLDGALQLFELDEGLDKGLRCVALQFRDLAHSLADHVGPGRGREQMYLQLYAARRLALNSGVSCVCGPWFRQMREDMRRAVRKRLDLSGLPELPSGSIVNGRTEEWGPR